MINSTYKPNNISEFEASKLNANFQGISGICIAGQSLNLDLTMTEDHLITGVQLLAKGSNFGDRITLQVVHPVYGVVNQFASDWQVCSDSEIKLDKEVIYPAKLFTGLILRVLYVSTGSIPVQVLVNYDLHKVLI